MRKKDLIIKYRVLPTSDVVLRMFKKVKKALLNTIYLYLQSISTLDLKIFVMCVGRYRPLYVGFRCCIKAV